MWKSRELEPAVAAEVSCSRRVNHSVVTLTGTGSKQEQQMSLSSILPVPLYHLSPETGREPGKGEMWFVKA